MDLWNYLVSFDLPKAALVKKMIRDNMAREQEGSIQQSKEPSPPTEKPEVAPEAKELEQPAEEKQARKKNSAFGGLAVKK